MKGVDIGILQKQGTGAYAGFLFLMVAMSYFIGCATDEKIKPAPVVQQPSVTEGYTVERFEDGRKGFIIKEVAAMDEAYLRDFEIAITMLNDREYEQAIELLEKIIEQSPGVTAPYIDIAIAYQCVGKLEQAEENLKAALRLIPEHPVACNEYGLLYRKTGRFAEAKAIYEKAITNYPDYYPAHKNLGILCDLYLNDPACALYHYKIYSEVVPEDKQVKLWIADLRNRLGRN